MKQPSSKLSSEQTEALLATLKTRFENNPERHEGIEWPAVAKRLRANPDKLPSLQEMEHSGGAPDVVRQDPETGKFVFYDCAPESPKGRRSLCYDREALESRKAHKPKDSALDRAAAMGIRLLTEAEYRALQHLGAFDTKTSSWVATPEPVRSRGGALFCDRRYGQVFLYHNGAESYYAARGFRGVLEI